MVLINPRVSHNFINEGFDEKGLRMKGFEGFQVSSANRELTLMDQIMEWFKVRL